MNPILCGSYINSWFYRSIIELRITGAQHHVHSGFDVFASSFDPSTSEPGQRSASGMWDVHMEFLSGALS